MTRPIFIHSSDWHLEKNAWTRHPDIYGDAYYGLEQVIDICLDRQLPLIGAGDLFDATSPDSTSVRFAMSQMDRMQTASLDVYYTQGQHEYQKDQPWLGLHPWPKHINNSHISVSYYVLAGLDFTRPVNLLNSLKAACSGADILVCHQVWEEFMPYGTSDGRLFDVPMKNGLILTGDFHAHKQLKINSNTVLSAGSLCLQSITEPAEKAVYIVYDDLSFDSVPIKSRQVFRYELNVQQDLDDFLATTGTGLLDPRSDVPDNIAKNIVHIRYNPEVIDVHAKIHTAIGDQVHLFISPLVVDDNIVTMEINEADTVIGLGLEGNLSKLCSPDSNTYMIAQRLLLSSNPDEELESIEQEFLKGPLNV